MASAILREECLTREQAPRDAPRYASTQQTANHDLREDAAQWTHRGSDEALARHISVEGRGRRSRRGFRRGICWVLLSVLIPALIISVWRAICKASMSGSSVREPGHTIRRLSDSKDASQGDTALSQLIEECVAMEEDLGQTVPQGSSSHHALDAAEHVARIAFALSQEALAFETEKQQAQQATHPTFSPILPYPASAGMNYHDQHLEEATGMAGQQAAELDEQLLLSGLTTAEHKPGSVPPEPLSSSALPVGGALQPVLLENQLVSESPSPFHWFEQGVPPQAGGAPFQFAADTEPVGSLQPLAAAPHPVGLLPHFPPLLPQYPSWDRPRKKRRVENSEEGFPEFKPDSWLDTVPMIDSSPEGQRQRQAPFCQGLSPEQTAPTSDAAGQVPSGEGRPGAVGQSPSSVPVRRTGGASPASAEANIAATSSAALAAPAARGDPIAATAAAGASAAGEARAASTSVAAADDPPAEAAAAGAANDPLRGAAKAGAAGEASATAASTPRAGEPSPGGALTTTGVANAEAYWIRTHPYVSLPVLQEGVVPPQIHLSASNFVTSNGSSVEGTLLCIRRLFMKQALDQIDASLLVGFLQELAIASAARARGAHRMLRAMHGVATIGLQFLVLDYTVSALHVLGISPPSCSWWEAFTECFDTGYRYMGPRRRTPYGRRVNIDLANRMLAAMSTYKAGTRPDLEEIVDLKRILFFSFCSPSDFRSHTWDPWRTDHLLFEREYPVFSGLLRLRRHIPH